MCWGRGTVASLLLSVGIGVFAATEAASAPPNLYGEAMLAIADGRIADAEKILVALAAMAAAEPGHAGAWLDLAMLYCAVGNSVSAAHLFTEIERRFAPPPAILEVMERQREGGCGGGRPKSDLTLRLGRGFESNVNQGASSPNFSFNNGISQIELVLLPEYLPRGDRFTQLSAELLRDFSLSGPTGVVQFQSKQYDNLSSYSYGSLFLGLDKPWQWGEWGLRAAGSTGFMTLGNKVYLKQNQLQMEVTPPLPLSKEWQLRLTGILNSTAYASLEGFDAQWREARATLSHHSEDWLLQASASSVQDQARGQRPGGNRAGMLAGLQGRMNLGKGVTAELGWQLQNWAGSRDYFPGLLDTPRLQRTRTFRASTTFPLSAEHALVLEFRDTRNHENISIFDYRNRTVQLNWQWQPRQMY